MSDERRAWDEPATPPEPMRPAREPDALAQLATVAAQLLVEQRRARRWKLVFRIAWFALAALLVKAMIEQTVDGSGAVIDGGGRHAAVVELSGLIASSESANADRFAQGLKAAFEDRDAAGIIIAIDSPGGSPVQAGQMYAEIRRQRAAHPDKPVYAVIGDAGASGGYYVAAAAQEIYADRASIVGSIGVRMDSFGFVEAMKNLGVERRLLTSGNNKGLLDPFSPENPQQVRHVQSLLDNIHGQFIAAVKEGRGERLSNDPVLFSGLIWTGEQAVALGLIDGLGSTRSVARDKLGTERLKDFTRRERAVDRLFGSVGASLGQGLLRALGLDAALR
ncbi:S49 family peptidase [Plasticicumulans acidivorans]|uniref:Protease-4 n=1 Tax=Plasticicumulans acidivorans TaxID=886464 RepID=A0A317MSI1_9GAMM|nr:S49 family peptidase [Plasticicumulans acidivorans]PWV59510.1 protease-4 [Plasticicumulans acidivorans]